MWLITKDYLDEENIPPARVGARSRDCPSPCDSTGWYSFRMLDDDGNVCYEGRSSVDNSFRPLDELGTPDAGCTEIQYRHGRKWETL